jgi:spermidine/putrescine transport system permease protein
MIPSLPRPDLQRFGLGAFVLFFFVFLFVPLLVVAVFAFNDAPYPTPPWMGFTLDWFTANSDERTGLLFDAELLGSIATSAWVALWVTILSVGVGTCNAFLLERFEFPGKGLVALLSMLPLVIPGVILGISILAFASRIANFADDTWGLELEFLRPGLPLVILGQFSYIVTIATLTVSASLRRFDRTLEEAALNLGASRLAVLPQHDRRRGHGVPDVVRELQYHADAGGLRFAAHGADVQPHARRRHTGAQRGEPVPDGGFGRAGAHAVVARQPSANQRLGACAAEGTSAATREKPVSHGTTSCAQGGTLGLSVSPRDPRFSQVSLRCLLPRRLLGSFAAALQGL